MAHMSRREYRMKKEHSQAGADQSRINYSRSKEWFHAVTPPRNREFPRARRRERQKSEKVRKDRTTRLHHRHPNPTEAHGEDNESGGGPSHSSSRWAHPSCAPPPTTATRLIRKTALP